MYKRTNHRNYGISPPYQIYQPRSIYHSEPHPLPSQQQPAEQPPVKKILPITKNYERPVSNLQELIEFCDSFDVEEEINYENTILNKSKALNLSKALKKLQAMIGMDEIKETLFYIILYYIQGVELKRVGLLHSVLYGNPGTGKSSVGMILAELYASIGVIDSPKIVFAKRSNLIAKFLGQTAAKTQEVIDSAKGGVLFIDEAYSLGNSEKSDSFSKECLDTLNQNLTEEGCNFICIIAGYKEALQSSFFAYNEGLERRFPIVFNIEEYTPDQLYLIFSKMVKDLNWNASIDPKFFEKNRHYFKYNGGDIENLVHFIKLAWGVRNFSSNLESKSKVFTNEDIELGLELMLKNHHVKEREILPRSKSLLHMYS